MSKNIPLYLMYHMLKSKLLLRRYCYYTKAASNHHGLSLNERQKPATLTLNFLKIDMRHGTLPSRAPILNVKYFVILYTFTSSRPTYWNSL